MTARCQIWRDRGAVLVGYLGFRRPDPNQDWAPEHSRTPAVRIDGDIIHVRNVRDFKWRSNGDSMPAYEAHEYDLNALNSLDYVLCPLARSSRQIMRGIFLDMMERAHSLEDHPEYYNLVTNNCLNNITAHLRRLGVSPPANLRLLFTGYSDRVAYDLGFIDTDLPFEKARRVFRVDGWMQTTPLDGEFSRRLRENLIRRVAKAGGRTDVIR